MKLTKGKVKYAPGKPKDYGNGLRINALVITNSNEEVRVWGAPDSPVSRLKKGDEVTMVEDDKGGYKLVEEEGGNEAPTPSTHQAPTEARKPATIGDEWTTEQKQQMAAAVKQDAALLLFCLQTAKETFADMNEESVRSLAVTLFIQTIRRVEG